MDKSLTCLRTLYYYDVPQIIELRDHYGGVYIGVLVDEDGVGFVATGVSPETLEMFCAGTVDLLEVMLKHGTREWFSCEPITRLDQPIHFTRRPDSLPESGFLPDAGFTLDSMVTSSELAAIASNRRQTVMELVLTDSTRPELHQVSVAILGDLLVRIQILIKNAFQHTGGHRSRSSLDVIVPATAGSFRTVLAPSARPDTPDEDNAAFALAFDWFCERLRDIGAGKQFDLEGSQHSSFAKLLGILAGKELDMAVGWVASDRRTGAGVRLTVEALSRGFQSLSNVHRADELHPPPGSGDLGLAAEQVSRTEPPSVDADVADQLPKALPREVEFSGILLAVDLRTGEWHIESQEAGPLRGKAVPSNQLAGLTVGAPVKLLCEIDASGGDSQYRLLDVSMG